MYTGTHIHSYVCIYLHICLCIRVCTHANVGMPVYACMVELASAGSRCCKMRLCTMLRSHLPERCRHWTPWLKSSGLQCSWLCTYVCFAEVFSRTVGVFSCELLEMSSHTFFLMYEGKAIRSLLPSTSLRCNEHCKQRQSSFQNILAFTSLARIFAWRAVVLRQWRCFSRQE